MKVLNNYKIEIILIMTLLVLVALKLLSGKQYKEEIQTAIDLSLNNSNVLSQIPGNVSNYILVDIRNENDFMMDRLHGFINIPFNTLAEEKIINQLSNETTSILLYSGDFSKSCKAWIILHQLGVTNLYILNNTLSNNEVLNYKFQPDTLAKPELNKIQL